MVEGEREREKQGEGNGGEEKRKMKRARGIVMGTVRNGMGKGTEGERIELFMIAYHTQMKCCLPPALQDS